MFFALKIGSKLLNFIIINHRFDGGTTMRSFQGKNEDDYMLFLGRKASGWGFIGVLVGIVISLLMDFPLAGLIFSALPLAI